MADFNGSGDDDDDDVPPTQMDYTTIPETQPSEGVPTEEEDEAGDTLAPSTQFVRRYPRTMGLAADYGEETALPSIEEWAQDDEAITQAFGPAEPHMQAPLAESLMELTESWVAVEDARADEEERISQLSPVLIEAQPRAAPGRAKTQTPPSPVLINQVRRVAAAAAASSSATRSSSPQLPDTSVPRNPDGSQPMLPEGWPLHEERRQSPGTDDATAGGDPRRFGSPSPSPSLPITPPGGMMSPDREPPGIVRMVSEPPSPSPLVRQIIQADEGKWQRRRNAQFTPTPPSINKFVPRVSTPRRMRDLANMAVPHPPEEHEEYSAESNESVAVIAETPQHRRSVSPEREGQRRRRRSRSRSWSQPRSPTRSMSFDFAPRRPVATHLHGTKAAVVLPSTSAVHALEELGTILQAAHTTADSLDRQAMLFTRQISEPLRSMRHQGTSDADFFTPETLELTYALLTRCASIQEELWSELNVLSDRVEAMELVVSKHTTASTSAAASQPSTVGKGPQKISLASKLAGMYRAAGMEAAVEPELTPAALLTETWRASSEDIRAISKKVQLIKDNVFVDVSSAILDIVQEYQTEEPRTCDHCTATAIRDKASGLLMTSSLKLDEGIKALTKTVSAAVFTASNAAITVAHKERGVSMSPVLMGAAMRTGPKNPGDPSSVPPGSLLQRAGAFIGAPPPQFSPQRPAPQPILRRTGAFVGQMPVPPQLPHPSVPVTRPQSNLRRSGAFVGDLPDPDPDPYSSMHLPLQPTDRNTLASVAALEAAMLGPNVDIRSEQAIRDRKALLDSLPAEHKTQFIALFGYPNFMRLNRSTEPNEVAYLLFGLYDTAYALGKRPDPSVFALFPFYVRLPPGIWNADHTPSWEEFLFRFSMLCSVDKQSDVLDQLNAYTAHGLLYYSKMTIEQLVQKHKSRVPLTDRERMALRLGKTHMKWYSMIDYMRARPIPAHNSRIYITAAGGSLTSDGTTAAPHARLVLAGEAPAGMQRIQSADMLSLRTPQEVPVPPEYRQKAKATPSKGTKRPADPEGAPSPKRPYVLPSGASAATKHAMTAVYDAFVDHSNRHTFHSAVRHVRALQSGAEYGKVPSIHVYRARDRASLARDMADTVAHFRNVADAAVKTGVKMDEIQTLRDLVRWDRAAHGDSTCAETENKAYADSYAQIMASSQSVIARHL